MPFFFFIFKHSWAPKRSWKIFHGCPESPGKVLDFFLSVKEWEPWHAIPPGSHEQKFPKVPTEFGSTLSHGRNSGATPPKALQLARLSQPGSHPKRSTTILYLRPQLIPLPLEALGHTLTPFCSVCRQFFVFIPDSVRVLQISSDDVHPVVPWPSLLSLVAAQFPFSVRVPATSVSKIRAHH